MIGTTWFAAFARRFPIPSAHNRGAIARCLAVALCAAVWVHATATAAESPLRPRRQIVYRGTLVERHAAQRGGEAERAASEKSFELTWIVASADDDGAKLYWLVEERGHGAWPWPERFGELALDAKGRPQGADAPSLFYEFEGGESAVPLPAPLLPVEKPLAAGAQWADDGFELEVSGEAQVDGRDAWTVRVRNRYGLRRTVQVAKDAPLVVTLAERVFMNMGTEYSLEMQLADVAELPAEEFDALRQGFASLVNLRAKLEHPARPQVADPLSGEQLALLTEALPAIETQTAPTLLGRLVASAARDVRLQTGRADEVAELVARYTGAPLGKFSLPGLTGGTLGEADLAGQVTVLHFWEYRDEPLKEPYGQVGYLEFLHQKRKPQGVKVYGIAVDGRFADETQRRAAMVSARKLRDFMNLSYPLALDSGEWLKSLGDPRLVGATLPLFVVVGRDGKIAHYHVGYYEVDRQEGLKALDAAVSEALRQPAP